MRRELLPLARPYITDSEINAVSEVLRSGQLTTGIKVAEFEEGLCQYLGEGIHGVGLSSCTAGLFLALLASEIGRGDDVIIPTWTFAATGHVVLWAGARPILCDVDEGSLNIDTQQLEGLITSKTKAIIPVHYAGYPCEMDKIREIAKRHSLLVIEDAAHAMGTKYKGAKIGTMGEIGAFSFYATKNLACGEGGMAVSRDKKLIEKIRKISYFGINKEVSRHPVKHNWYYEIEEMGYKFNMDNMHAAIGLVQLKKLDEINQRRRNIAALYKGHLDKRIRFTDDSNEHYHTYHLFPIRIAKRIIERNDFINHLKKRNIQTSVHFIPLHKHPFYKDRIEKKRFPVADRAYEEIVSIPMFATMSEEDIFYVVENINHILKKRG